MGKGKPSIVRMPKALTNLCLLEETSNLPKNYQKQDIMKAPLCLLRDIKAEKLLNSLKTLQEVSINNKDLAVLLDYSGDLSNVDNLIFAEEATGYNMNFFMRIANTRERRVLYNRVYRSESSNEKQLNLIVDSRLAFCDDAELSITGIVFKDIGNKKTVVCHQCDETFARMDSFKRHQDNPTACQTGTIVRPKSKVYGKNEDVPQQLLEAGYILPEHLNFKQTNFCVFDIETTEEICEDDSRERAILSVLSISFASSLDNKPYFFVRNGDTLEDAKDLVKRFLDCVEEKAVDFKSTFPDKFQESLTTILKIESERREEHKRRQEEGVPPQENKLELFPASWKSWLRSMSTFKCFGFNSSRFDCRVIAPQLFDVLLDDMAKERNLKGTQKPKLSVLKLWSKFLNKYFLSHILMSTIYFDHF